MDPQEVDTFVQRLVANPHDPEALAYAHQAGMSDPRSYATLLERVGRETTDPAYACHWLSEAANVWSTALADAHHAAEVLLLAVVKDPSQDVPAERLAQLYREKGDVRGLVALLEKRAKMLAPSVQQNPELAPKVAAMHEELGTLWSDPLGQPQRALEHFRSAYEFDPNAVFAIYSAREILKASQQYAEAVPLFAMERALVQDPERAYALLADEVEVRRNAQDLRGVTETMRLMRSYAPEDWGLMQQLASSILERVRAGEDVPSDERDEGSALFVALAEAYGGEHGYLYSVAALEIMPGHDRAVQLATHYGSALGRDAELPPMWKKYMAANPTGLMAADIGARLAALGQDVPEPQPSQPAEAQAAPASAPASVEPAAEAPQSVPAQESQPAASAPVEAPVASTQPEPAPVVAEPSSAMSAEPQAAVQPEPAPQPQAAPAVEAPAPQPAPEPARRTMESLSPEHMAKLLDEAAALASKRMQREALAKYMEVLHFDPVSPEALAWVDEHLRSKRKFADLRDVYQNASRASTIPPEQRKKYLSNVAAICEQQLRDLDGAIAALKQAAQIDSSVRDNLRRLLEKGQRWDDLAVLIDQEVMDAPDPEAQIALLKKAATMHEQKRKDVVAAGEAWARLATIMTGDESPVLAAVKLFEKGNRFDLAADVIAENCSSIESDDTRSSLLMKLGELREKVGDLPGAGEAYANAADLNGGIKAWEAAERCYESCEHWDDAARAVGERANLTDDPKQKAALLVRESELWVRAGDQAAAIERLEQGADLDPVNDAYAQRLEECYTQADRTSDLVNYLLRRAEALMEPSVRVSLRKRAAEMQRSRLEDMDATRDTLLLVLEDVNDPEALTLLADDARARGDFQEEASLLHRLAGALTEPAERANIILREAAVLANDLDELDAAVDAYEALLQGIDPKNIEALNALADLEQRRENPKGSAHALERLLALVPAGEEKVEIARRLGDLYRELDDVRGAIRALEVVRESDPDDYEAIGRLADLCESVEDWPRTAELLALLIEVEGDPQEASSLALRLSAILEQRLDRGQDAMSVLEPVADAGDEACRQAYVDLGDRLGFKGIVAMKLRDWYALASGDRQREAFCGAFERFLEMNRDAEAAQIAVELIRMRAASTDIVQRLEQIAIKLKDLDSLGVAHDALVRELGGVERANEYVRQAAALVEAGVEAAEAVQHGEQGLASVPAAEVEGLLERLSGIVAEPGLVVDLYERQVGRCKAPADKLQALARAAQVAAAHGAIDRAKNLFELALGGGAKEETIEALERAAAEGDERLGNTALREALAVTLATGSISSRDGGRTRSALLRRAAIIAYRELGDVDRAFGWFAESLVAHVDPATLDALEELGDEAGDLQRVEQAIGKALEEVFDGPLVRQLVARRAKLRRERLGNLQGAAEDLKRLHDLTPSDKAISDELYGLLKELRDYRGMVQLLEDQILRGKDPAVRAELARNAARIWEERLADPREAADAWRRVLRMKPGDPEAQAGLERAKSNMLKRPESLLPPEPPKPEPVVAAPPPAPPAHEPPASAQPEAEPTYEQPAPVPADLAGPPENPEPTEQFERFGYAEDAAPASYQSQAVTGYDAPAPQPTEPDAAMAPPPFPPELPLAAQEAPVRELSQPAYDDGELTPVGTPVPSENYRGDEALDQPLLDAPVAAPLDAAPPTDEYPAAPEGDFVPDDLIEAVDDIEPVDDDDLLDLDGTPATPAEVISPRK